MDNGNNGNQAKMNFPDSDTVGGGGKEGCRAESIALICDSSCLTLPSMSGCFIQPKVDEKQHTLLSVSRDKGPYAFTESLPRINVSKASLLRTSDLLFFYWNIAYNARLRFEPSKVLSKRLPFDSKISLKNGIFAWNWRRGEI